MGYPHISSYFIILQSTKVGYDGMHYDVCNLVILHLYLDQSITMSLIKTCCGCEKKFGQAARKLLDQMQLGLRPPKSLHVSWPRWGDRQRTGFFCRKSDSSPRTTGEA